MSYELTVRREMGLALDVDGGVGEMEEGLKDVMDDEQPLGGGWTLRRPSERA